MSRQLHQALLGRSMMSYHSAHTWRTVQRSRAKGNRATGNKGAFNCTYHTQTHAHTKTHTHTHTQRHTHTHTHTHTCCTQTLSGRAVSNSDRKAIALSEWKQRRSHCTHTHTHIHTHTHTAPEHCAARQLAILNAMQLHWALGEPLVLHWLRFQ